MTAHQEIMPGAPVLPLVPRSIEETWRIAIAVMKAGIAPDGVDTPEKALIILMHGLEVGFTPMAALQSIALINKKPVIWGDGALALVRSHRDFEWIKEEIGVYDGSKTARCAVKRKGEDVITREFSWAQAVAADLTNKAIWKKYPDRMLQMRARAFALRDAFADAFKGLGIREEVMDWDMARNAPKPPAGASKGHTATPGHPEVTTLPGAIPVAGEGDLVERSGAGFEKVDRDTGEVMSAQQWVNAAKADGDRRAAEMMEEPPPVKLPPHPPSPPRPPSARTAAVEQDTFPPDRLRAASAATGTNGKPSHPLGSLSAGLPNDPGPIPVALVRGGTLEALAKHRPDFQRDPITTVYDYIAALFKLVQTFDEFEKVCERYIDPFVADIPQDIDRDGVRGYILEYEQRWAP